MIFLPHKSQSQKLISLLLYLLPLKLDVESLLLLPFNNPNEFWKKFYKLHGFDYDKVDVKSFENLYDSRVLFNSQNQLSVPYISRKHELKSFEKHCKHRYDASIRVHGSRDVNLLMVVGATGAGKSRFLHEALSERSFTDIVERYNQASFDRAFEII